MATPEHHSNAAPQLHPGDIALRAGAVQMEVPRVRLPAEVGENFAALVDAVMLRAVYADAYLAPLPHDRQALGLVSPDRGVLASARGPEADAMLIRRGLRELDVTYGDPQTRPALDHAELQHLGPVQPVDQGILQSRPLAAFKIVKERINAAKQADGESYAEHEVVARDEQRGREMKLRGPLTAADIERLTAVLRDMEPIARHITLPDITPVGRWVGVRPTQSYPETLIEKPNDPLVRIAGTSVTNFTRLPIAGHRQNTRGGRGYFYRAQPEIQD